MSVFVVFSTKILLKLHDVREVNGVVICIVGSGNAFKRSFVRNCYINFVDFCRTPSGWIPSRCPFQGGGDERHYLSVPNLNLMHAISTHRTNCMSGLITLLGFILVSIYPTNYVMVHLTAHNSDSLIILSLGKQASREQVSLSRTGWCVAGNVVKRLWLLKQK